MQKLFSTLLQITAQQFQEKNHEMTSNASRKLISQIPQCFEVIKDGSLAHCWSELKFSWMGWFVQLVEYTGVGVPGKMCQPATKCYNFDSLNSNFD